MANDTIFTPKGERALATFESTHQPNSAITPKLRPTQGREANLQFLLPSQEEWSRFGALTSFCHAEDAIDGLYSTSALCRDAQEHTEKTQEILAYEADKIINSGDKNAILPDAAWKEIGIYDLNLLFESLAPFVKKILATPEKIAAYNTRGDKGDGAKTSHKRECEAEIARIRHEEIFPLVKEFMKKHLLVGAITDAQIWEHYEHSMQSTMEETVNTWCLDPNRKEIKAAMVRFFYDEAPLAGDKELLAPYQPKAGCTPETDRQAIVEYVSDMLFETGIAAAGPIITGIQGTKLAIEKYQQYYSQTTKTADPKELLFNLITAMPFHEKASVQMKLALERLQNVCGAINMKVAEPDLTNTQLLSGQAAQVATEIGVLQKGYVDKEKTVALTKFYDEWAKKTNTKPDEYNQEPRGKAAIWLRETQNFLEYSQGNLVDNVHLFEKCKQAALVLAQAEKEERKPTQDELKNAYKTFTITHNVLNSFIQTMTQINSGMPLNANGFPSEVPKDMKPIHDKIKFRAGQQCAFLQKNTQALNALTDAITAPLDAMEKARLNAETLLEHAQTFFDLLETRQTQWAEHQKTLASPGTPGA